MAKSGSGYSELDNDIWVTMAGWPRKGCHRLLFIWGISHTPMHRATGISRYTDEKAALEIVTTIAEVKTARIWLVKHKVWVVKAGWLWVVKAARRTLFQKNFDPNDKLVRAANNFFRDEPVPEGIRIAFMTMYRKAFKTANGYPIDRVSLPYDQEIIVPPSVSGSVSESVTGDQYPPRPPTPAETGSPGSSGQSAAPKPNPTRAARAERVARGQPRAEQTKTPKPWQIKKAIAWANIKFKADNEEAQRMFRMGDLKDQQAFEDLLLQIKELKRLMSKDHTIELVKHWNAARAAGEPRGV